jgi:hypothetical protein
LSKKTHIARTEPFRWAGVPVLAYKEEGGTHFKGVTRQVLFDDDEYFESQLRYFEIAPGGHLVGEAVVELGTQDLIQVPPLTWHQFRATGAEPLGFLCLVRRERDKPVLPTERDLAALRADPRAAAFIRV